MKIKVYDTRDRNINYELKYKPTYNNVAEGLFLLTSVNGKWQREYQLTEAELFELIDNGIKIKDSLKNVSD